MLLVLCAVKEGLDPISRAVSDRSLEVAGLFRYERNNAQLDEPNTLYCLLSLMRAGGPVQEDPRLCSCLWLPLLESQQGGLSTPGVGGSRLISTSKVLYLGLLRGFAWPQTSGIHHVAGYSACVVQAVSCECCSQRTRRLMRQTQPTVYQCFVEISPIQRRSFLARTFLGSTRCACRSKTEMEATLTW